MSSKILTRSSDLSFSSCRDYCSNVWQMFCRYCRHLQFFVAWRSTTQSCMRMWTRLWPNRKLHWRLETSFSIYLFSSLLLCECEARPSTWSSGPGWSPGRGRCVLFSGKTTLKVHLSTQVCKWVLTNLKILYVDRHALSTSTQILYHRKTFVFKCFEVHVGVSGVCDNLSHLTWISNRNHSSSTVSISFFWLEWFYGFM